MLRPYADKSDEYLLVSLKSAPVTRLVAAQLCRLGEA
jgi:hypothetical protein